VQADKRLFCDLTSSGTAYLAALVVFPQVPFPQCYWKERWAFLSIADGDKVPRNLGARMIRCGN